MCPFSKLDIDHQRYPFNCLPMHSEKRGTQYLRYTCIICTTTILYSCIFQETNEQYRQRNVSIRYIVLLYFQAYCVQLIINDSYRGCSYSVISVQQALFRQRDYANQNDTITCILSLQIYIISKITNIKQFKVHFNRTKAHISI